MRTAGRLIALGILGARVAAAAQPLPGDRAALHWIRQEVEIAAILDDLSRRAVGGFVVFKDVSIIDPRRGTTVPAQTVVVRDSKIAWIGDSTAAPDVAGATVVEGKGSFLSPGLVDMHVHTVSLAEQLLRLAAGNTAVRDMDGFPWMLELRRAIEGRQLLAPTEYIAGTIIASHPLDGYAVVVRTEGEARLTVRKEAACGYDFIKVHNLLRLPLFDAVADETRRAGLDLVGHVPHDISIDHAVHAAGMRTLEHLKGFINDRDLIVSGEDYEKALAGAEVWLTPTFYANTIGRREAAAGKLLSLPEMQYVALRRRMEWAAPSPDDAANDARVQKLLDVALPAAIGRLLPLHPRWLAGTDAAEYPLQVAGFGLLDELLEMEAFGVPIADVIRAATSEPAAALHRANEFGSVTTGMRADLILLGADPARDLGAFRNNRGTMVGGRWLSRSLLDAALVRLAQIQGEPDAQFGVSGRTIRALIADVDRLAARHIALDAMHLTAAAEDLARLGYKEEGARLASIVALWQTGPCNEVTPPGGG